MDSILYIGYEFCDGQNGGNVVRKAHYELLKEIYQDRLKTFLYQLDKNKIKILKNYIFFSFNGQNKKLDKKIIKLIKDERIKKVILDSSLFGNLVKKIKKFFPDIKIITFFHNIEINYFRERIKIEGKSRYLLLPSVYFNEYLSVKYSDEIILLNKRDLVELNKNYRILNQKIHIIPIYLKDRYKKIEKEIETEYQYLFIGSAFFANLEGISWFIEEVLPNIDGNLLILGNGMEILKDRYKETRKLKIIGRVKNIDEFYYKNNIIISPIFSGSGMKTKTIEAMMFNKKIVGTNEAFIGIEKTICGIELANTKEEFIEVLKNNKNLKVETRKIFLMKYSFEKNKNKIKEIIDGK